MRAQQKSLQKSPESGYRHQVKQELIEWMRLKGLRAEQVGKHLNVSAQTVRNWRATGVPPRQEEQVRKLIASWDQSPANLLGRIILSPTPDQFRTWNKAALAKGLIIEEWAVKGLDDLAEEQDQKTTSTPPAGPPPRIGSTTYPNAAQERRLRALVNEEEPEADNGTEGN